MKVLFEIKDMHDGPYPEVREVDRKLYKGFITRLDREGKPFRVGLKQDGEVITKTLTVLVQVGAE